MRIVPEETIWSPNNVICQGFQTPNMVAFILEPCIITNVIERLRLS